VRVSGEPLLGRWLRQLDEADCEAVIINTHHLAQKVHTFLDTWELARQTDGMAVQRVHEPKLLGTAGTLLANQGFFTGSTGLLIHADNAMAGSLDGLLAAHRRRPQECILTMLTFRTNQPQSCGIVGIDRRGVVTSFHEKVAEPPGDQANGAVYCFDHAFLSYLSKVHPEPTDFSTEVIPNLMGRIHTWQTNQPYLDIGTPTALEAAQGLLKPQSPLKK